MLSQVARRLGHGDAFAYRSAADIFDEHARLSGFENGGSRAFDISGLVRPRERLSTHCAVSMALRARTKEPTERMLGRRPLLHPDGKARFVAIAEPRLFAAVSMAWPFVSTPAASRPVAHMTRTGLSRACRAHVRTCSRRSIPDDAASVGLVQGALARVSTEHGAARARAGQTAGSSGARCSCRSIGRPRTAQAGAFGALVQPATDPYSGQPEAKATPARIAPLAVSHYGWPSRASR
jgi:assimilatory nitrate reductase catalytic subunit